MNVEAIIAERDRLRVEVVLLRGENAKLQGALDARSLTAARAVGEPPPLPRPSPVPNLTGAAAATGALYAPGAVPAGHPASPGAMAGDAPGGLDFGSVSRLSPSELDTLPYGLICVDAQGRVVHYNDTESRLARLPKERVIGRSFFGEVAPCARVREFEGQFLELVRDPSRVRVRTFDFVFRFSHGEQRVTIVMTPARTRGLYNIALLRRALDEA